ncbi:unnamed protein product, partial [Dicrocoelium dendriticum]
MISNPLYGWSLQLPPSYPMLSILHEVTYCKFQELEAEEYRQLALQWLGARYYSPGICKGSSLSEQKGYRLQSVRFLSFYPRLRYGAAS